MDAGGERERGGRDRKMGAREEEKKKKREGATWTWKRRED